MMKRPANSMRSPREQEDFLERGRFNDDQVRSRLNPPLMAGLLLIAAGATCLGVAALFHIGRDDGGPFLLLGALMAFVLGIALAAFGLWRMSRR